MNSLRPAEEGIQASGRASGWLGTRWLAMLRADAERLARGRNRARAGRVRELFFSPGLATAEVVDEPGRDPHFVSIRVDVLETKDWTRFKKVLREKLAWPGALLEGDLSRALVDRCEQAGVALVPSAREVEGDCDCADWLHPCAHIVATHVLLAEALDGDPFVLFTLRGRDRDAITDVLKTVWGGTAPDAAPPPSAGTPPSEGFFQSKVALPRMRFSFDLASGLDTPALALSALGPAPDGVDLAKVLAPLYEAGGRAAMLIATADAELPPPLDAVEVPEEEAVPDPEPEPSIRRRRREDEPLTEELVNLLSAVECARSQELADHLGASVLEVRHELIELERLGIVYRTGNTRGTRWWLG